MSIILLNDNKEELILIPNEAIRVRIIANSNSDKDIQEKEKIKEEINKFVDKKINNVTNINDVRKIIVENIKNIENVVEKTMKENNYQKTFKINYGMNYFPDKEFKGVKYNKGNYESLVITIGEGKGNNYWCVLYPPLCKIDNNENNDYRFLIKEILNKYL